VVIPRSRTQRRNEAKQERKGRSKNESFTLVHGAKETGRSDGSFRSFSNETSSDDVSRKSVSRHSPLFALEHTSTRVCSVVFSQKFIQKSVKLFFIHYFVCRYIDRRRDFAKVPKKFEFFREKFVCRPFEHAARASKVKLAQFSENKFVSLRHRNKKVRITLFATRKLRIRANFVLS